MIFKPNINLRERFSSKFIVLFLFIILIVLLGINHTIEELKNPPAAKTDKMEYNVNEKILLEIENKLPQQIVMRGCQSFIVQEKKENGSWENDSGSLVCNRDETISIFRKRKNVVDFTPKYPGQYRILINYKMYYREREGSDRDKPTYLPKLYSNEFSVR